MKKLKNWSQYCYYISEDKVPKISSGEIRTIPGDNTWEYKVEENDWFARKKGTSTWYRISGEGYKEEYLTTLELLHKNFPNDRILTVNLPTIDISADKKTGQLLPNWNKLTSEEKKLFWVKGPIGRNIRLKAGMKYPDELELPEHQVDLAVELLSAALDSVPSVYTQVASFLIDILHCLSYFIRWKKAKTESDKVRYFLLCFFSLILLWIPRAGNLIMSRLPNQIKTALQRYETLKGQMTATFWGKVIYVITSVFIVNKIQNLPDPENVKNHMAERRKKNPLYATILGDYDKHIDEMLIQMLKVYREVKYVLENEEEIKKRGLKPLQQEK